ncbi:sugar transporter ERD6-like 8 [Impatiens glandulifera]|uniref:sugar transporter ERD6-like 8 n=1 Tax=Impatiens glandulifera TaxID=253017 RepID=UPI001FB09DE0|nr:sugar transporter ERD6-like 8 [Impatiens glandulifera]
MPRYEDSEKGDEKKKMKEPFLWKEDKKEHKEEEDGALFTVLLSTAVAVCGSFAFGTCIGYSAPTQDAIMMDLQLSYAQYSVFGSILNIGAILGAITCGNIADFLGRKGAMRISAFVCILGWIAIYMAVESVMLDFGRFLSGYGIGVFSYVVPVYIGEITPTSLRGGLASANQLLIVIGLGSSYILGAFISWRMLALTGIIPCMFVFLGLFFVPESPRWLLMAGRSEDFLVALQHLRGPDTDITREAENIKDYLESLKGLPKVTFIKMFDKANIHPLTISVGLMAFQQLVGINGIVFYANYIFKSAGFDPSKGTIIYAILQIVITAVGASIVDKAGRRPLLLTSAAGLLMGNLLIASSFFLKAREISPDIVPYIAVIGVLVYIGSFSVGMGAGPWLIMSEVFPLHIKGMGGSLVTITNWSGSWLVSYTFNFLMLWSSYGTFLLYASVCALAIVFIYNMVPETKGKTLEEIHASMNSS